MQPSLSLLVGLGKSVCQFRVQLQSQRHSSVVLLEIVLSVCPKEGPWEVTEGGEERVLQCTGDTVGPLVRRCRAVSVTQSQWDDPDYQYCLPKYSPEGMGYIDFIVSIPYSKTVMILKNPSGIVAAFSSVCKVMSDQISIHRIAYFDKHVCSAPIDILRCIYHQETQVQVRLSVKDEDALSLYNVICSSEMLNKISSFLLENNDQGMRLFYFVDNCPSSIEIICTYGPLLNYAKSSNRNMVFLTIGIIVGVGIVVVFILSFYIWRQYKLCRPQRTTHLITPSPMDMDMNELPIQYVQAQLPHILKPHVCFSDLRTSFI